MLEDPQGILQAGTNLQKCWSTERVDESGGLGEAIWIFRSQLSTVMRETASGQWTRHWKTWNWIIRLPQSFHRFFAGLPKTHIAPVLQPSSVGAGLLGFLECIQARNPESFPTKDANGLSSKASTTRSEINRAAGDFDAFAQLAERFGSFFWSDEASESWHGPFKRPYFNGVTFSKSQFSYK